MRRPYPTMYLDLKKKVGDSTAIFTDADRIRALETKVEILVRYVQKQKNPRAAAVLKKVESIGAYKKGRP